MDKQYPLIIVFYLDKELMQTPEIIKPFADAVNDALAKRQANAMAFFIPTKGEERVECINPIMIKEADMAEINKMIEDIKEAFSIGVDIDIPDEEITLDSKPCECGQNPDGTCKCD